MFGNAFSALNFSDYSAKSLDNLCPQQSGSPHLRDFHVEIHPDAPEKTEPRRKIVNL